MRIEARVPEFSDLLGEKLHTVRRIAKDNRLVDLELGEESVEAVDLLLLFHKGIVLRDSPKGEFIHEVDLVRIAHMFVLEHKVSDRSNHIIPGIVVCVCLP